MKEQFNLSKMIWSGVIFSSDVKEFIRLLKKELSTKSCTWDIQQEIIDKLAGDKLT